MPAEPTIDYETLAQAAMRGVVRSALLIAAKSGLPGDHHFFISFETTHPGVTLSKRLREKYPQEMTIVLQHRFWDLSVTDDRFEVKLTFDGIPERLVIPFAAIKVFIDPSVQYALQFGDLGGDDYEGDAGRAEGRGAHGTTRSAAARKPRAPRKPRGEAGSAPTPLPGNVASNVKPISAIGPPAGAPPAPAPASVKPQPAAASGAGKTEAPEPAVPANGGAQVVSLDQFRKK